MALFNKETDRNVKSELAPKVQLPAMAAVTSNVVATSAGPSERQVTPFRQAQPTNQEARAAYLDSGCKISGKISFEGAIRIDGQVDGEIIGKESLTIGESATVTAQIRAASIIVAGKVSGDIFATQRIEIRPSARVLGNLTSPVLVVHEGAIFEGHSSMQPEAAREERKVTVFPKEERLAQAAGQKQS
jgi:cytoskeletal protein CcmA (bactofilin family)